MAGQPEIPALYFSHAREVVSRDSMLLARSPRMPWYQGSPLLYTLENAYVGSDANHVDPRFSVQWVIRPNVDAHHDFRGLAGRVAGGVFKPGDEVVALPSGLTTRIKQVYVLGEAVAEAYAPMNAVITLEDEIDLSRGDLLAKPHNAPQVARDLEVMVCWFAEKNLQPGGRYLVRHLTRETRCVIEDVRYKVNINTLHKQESDRVIGVNDIGRIRRRTAAPLFFDSDKRNRNTGSLILIDELTNNTVAARMILEAMGPGARAETYADMGGL